MGVSIVDDTPVIPTLQIASFSQLGLYIYIYYVYI
jgi:hypothetical protein